MGTRLNITSLDEQLGQNLEGLFLQYDEEYLDNTANRIILEKLNAFLLKHEMPITINVEILSDKHSEIALMNVLKELSNVTDLNIYVAFGEIIQLSNFQDLLSLNKLRLRQNFIKGLDLSVLLNYKHLNFFELENGLDKKQHVILNQLNTLKNLRLGSLDLPLINGSSILENLRIYNQIGNFELLREKYPNLKSIYLEKCNKLKNLSALAELENIESIWLRYMKHVEVIPLFKNPEKIKLFQTTSLPKISDLKSIRKMNNLMALMMTDLDVLELEDFEFLKNLKSLEVVYITFKDKKENERMKSFLERNWIYKQPGLVGEKYYC